MQIQHIAHQTLSETVAGRLAASILDGTFKTGDQLPPERELMSQLGVSRATLREALKALGESKLIEARPGIGWFVCDSDQVNLAQAHELARGHRPATESQADSGAAEAINGPKRLEVTSEKPLHIPNLRTYRLGTFDLISWWEREKVQTAKVLVVGAGALGNEVIKNLTLMGVGHIFVLDFDTVEAANLSRSVLFREGDS